MWKTVITWDKSFELTSPNTPYWVTIARYETMRDTSIKHSYRASQSSIDRLNNHLTVYPNWQVDRRYEIYGHLYAAVYGSN